MQNIEFLTEIHAKIYRARLKEYAYLIIKQYIFLTKKIENCFYIVNLYFSCTFPMRS